MAGIAARLGMVRSDRRKAQEVAAEIEQMPICVACGETVQAMLRGCKHDFWCCLSCGRTQPVETIGRYNETHANARATR